MGANNSSEEEKEQQHTVLFKRFSFSWQFNASKFFDARSRFLENESPVFKQPEVDFSWFLRIERDSCPDNIQVWLCLKNSLKTPVLAEYELALKGNKDAKSMSEVKDSHVYMDTATQSKKCVLVRTNKESPLSSLEIHARVYVETKRKVLSTKEIASDFSDQAGLQNVPTDSRDTSGGSASKISSDLLSLLSTGMHSDVQIDVFGLKVKSHKCLLSCRSPVFAAMFNNGMAEARNNMVKITDFDLQIFLEFLRFIYSGNAPEFTYDSALELLRASDKYDVGDLKALCSDYLIGWISESNAFALLRRASDFNAPILKEGVLNYVAKNITTFSARDDYAALPSDLLTDILLKVASSDNRNHDQM